MSDSGWYVVKQPDGHCAIVPAADLVPSEAEQWGPFDSQAQAIARRVGLIRAGKCQPA
jgi:hypothetical protein